MFKALNKGSGLLTSMGETGVKGGEGETLRKPSQKGAGGKVCKLETGEGKKTELGLRVNGKGKKRRT